MLEQLLARRLHGLLKACLAYMAHKIAPSRRILWIIYAQMVIIESVVEMLELSRPAIVQIARVLYLLVYFNAADLIERRLIFHFEIAAYILIGQLAIFQKRQSLIRDIGTIRASQ